jgi:hypothetical protein
MPTEVQQFHELAKLVAKHPWTPVEISGDAIIKLDEEIRHAEKQITEFSFQAGVLTGKLMLKLEELEWEWNENGLQRCPDCGGYKEKYERLGERYNDQIGHADDCELDDILHGKKEWNENELLKGGDDDEDGIST